MFQKFINWLKNRNSVIHVKIDIVHHIELPSITINVNLLYDQSDESKPNPIPGRQRSVGEIPDIAPSFKCGEIPEVKFGKEVDNA